LGTDAWYWGSSCSYQECSNQEKRSAYTSRSKEAFPADESALGGKKKSRRKTKACQPQKGRAYTCRPKETFRTNESSLGSQKESRLEISNSGRYKTRLDNKE
jgi:hypothetical protein